MKETNRPPNSCFGRLAAGSPCYSGAKDRLIYGGSEVKACGHCKEKAEWRFKTGWGALACADWFA